MIQAQATSVLDRLLDSVGRTMTPDFAQELVEFRAAPDVQARIDDLAEKCNEGQLSDNERAEYENYVQAIHFIAILQRKAKRFLANGPSS